jgi:hypothetical protein
MKKNITLTFKKGMHVKTMLSLIKIHLDEDKFDKITIKRLK